MVCFVYTLNSSDKNTIAMVYNRWNNLHDTEENSDCPSRGVAVWSNWQVSNCTAALYVHYTIYFNRRPWNRANTCIVGITSILHHLTTPKASRWAVFAILISNGTVYSIDIIRVKVRGNRIVDHGLFTWLDGKMASPPETYAHHAKEWSLFMKKSWMGA